MDNRQISDEYAQIGAKVIDTEETLIDIRNSHATIIYLTSENKKLAKGKTERTGIGRKQGIKRSVAATSMQGKRNRRGNRF